MLNLFCALLWTLLLGQVSASEERNITAGQDVTLTCRAPNSNIIVVEWSRADLGSEYVLLYRDGQFAPEEQHPSFKNRVDLQDHEMKDGDVSLILKNVTVNDAGTYECRVFMRRTKRALLKTAPIIIITLRVSPPPPPPPRPPPPGHRGGATEDEEEEDGGKQDEVSRGHYGLSVFGFFCVVLVAFLVFRVSR